MSKTVTPIFEANMDAAQRAHYRRTGAAAIDPGLMPFQQLKSMPFDEALREEDDGEGGEITDYEMRQRVIGVRAMFRKLKERGVTMPQIMKQLFAVGRTIHDPFFSSLSMTESGLMFSETKSAHSWRCKVLSGEIKLAGALGYQLPGQKTPEARPKYAAAAKRTCNRAKKPKQGSFLRKLKTGGNVQRPTSNAQRPTQRQTTFTSKLLGGNGAAKTGSEGGSPSQARESRALPSESRALPGHRSAVSARRVA
jgi:hypothetical protein